VFNSNYIRNKSLKICVQLECHLTVSVSASASSNCFSRSPFFWMSSASLPCTVVRSSFKSRSCRDIFFCASWLFWSRMRSSSHSFPVFSSCSLRRAIWVSRRPRVVTSSSSLLSSSRIFSSSLNNGKNNSKDKFFYGRSVAKLVACLLAAAALWVRISLKNTKWAKFAKECMANTL
jgi:hypothetical protein